MRTQLHTRYDEAVEKTRAALRDEGFGVLTEIDVKATLKQKLDVDVDNYIILGACNPPLAHEALSAEREIGLLLPCNVIVYEQNGAVYVSAIKPSVAMRMVENDALTAVAKEVEQKLSRVIQSLSV